MTATADQFKRAREITGEIEDIEIEIEAARTMMKADHIQVYGVNNSKITSNLEIKVEEIKKFLESVLEIRVTQHKALIEEMENL